MTVKNVLIALFALLALCSCEKDYHKLQKERVEQYKKEGKWIIAQSDSTSNEHYIIYGDKKTQTIGIDTLGGDVQVVDLKKPMTQVAFAPLWGGSGFKMLTDMEEHYGWGSGKDFKKSLIKIVDKAFENTDDGVEEEKQNHTTTSIQAYKNKYIIINFDRYYPDVYRYILFFTNPPKLYYFGTSMFYNAVTNDWYADLGIDETTGNITGTFKWNDYPEYENIPILNCLYRATIDDEGNLVSKDDYLLINGDKVPVHIYTSGYYYEHYEEQKRH